MLWTLTAIAIFLLVMTISCSKSVVIESNTTWSAALGTSTEAVSTARSVTGVGSTTLAAEGQTVCWVVQKTTRVGTLRVYLTEHSIIGIDRVADNYTVADYGLVAGCAP